MRGAQFRRRRGAGTVEEGGQPLVQLLQLLLLRLAGTGGRRDGDRGDVAYADGQRIHRRLGRIGVEAASGELPPAGTLRAERDGDVRRRRFQARHEPALLALYCVEGRQRRRRGAVAGQRRLVRHQPVAECDECRLALGEIVAAGGAGERLGQPLEIAFGHGVALGGGVDRGDVGAGRRQGVARRPLLGVER